MSETPETPESPKEPTGPQPLPEPELPTPHPPAPAPPSPAPPLRPVASHNGVVILVLGILSVVLSCGCCPFVGPVLGLVATVMGIIDLKRMRAGRMDRSGEGLTIAGLCCGILSIVIAILVFIFYATYSITALFYELQNGGLEEFLAD